MKRRFELEEEPSEENLINLTPLIDVVFVVLISFMMIAPLLNVDRVELAAAGEKAEKISSQSSALCICIHANNSISVGKRETSLRELELLLKTEKKIHPKDTPVLLCDKSGSFGTYNQVKNLIEAAGFDQLDVALKPK
jgi:biopolymer transport protein ExbD